jgi:fatty acid-binding protein DegV
LNGRLQKVKPILQLKDGQVEPFEQVRMKKRALNRLVEFVTEQLKSDCDAHLCVLQADAVNSARDLAVELVTRPSVPVPPSYELPPAIVVHTGPGTMGVGFFV